MFHVNSNGLVLSPQPIVVAVIAIFAGAKQPILLLELKLTLAPGEAFT